ncbi:ATP-binding response regulator [Pedobacter chitinilyticus]|uniref:histidine kinase n=1 Tax=Pedobacter chitinilyticus TaxID=2233776 RepID=A0A3S3PSU8_9SPHI|nr:ATP-binding protein [Pedobacter chitinilyticus]RWU05484.1 response regulator [Pedobacter chitinilyticus]
MAIKSAAPSQKRFFTATKGKVVLGFLFAGLALLLAWGVSRFVFGEILVTVEKISAPNDKLRIVNKLSHQIASLDQLQGEPKNNVSFFAATQKLSRTLDTLTTLYDNDPEQLKRIKTLKNLLKDRDKQFLLYLEVKENLVNTQSFSEEVGKLNELFTQRTREADSAVFTTETSTSTTTVAPEEEQKSRGFLARLFGKKKAEVYKIISEEYKVKRDTLNPQVQDSLIQNVEATLKTIETEQQKKSKRFLKKEAELASSSSALTKQMLNVLKEVEAEALMQIDLNGEQAKGIVNEGVFQIKVIIIAFFVITLILGSLILADITKNNKYRLALEKAKEEAEYHGRAKQRFLSNMSHEIRTPLQAILGYAEFIAKQENPNKKHVEAIHRSSVHLLQIVNEVLDYNRITSGEFSFQKADFDLKRLLDEVIDAMKPLAEKKGISLLVQFNLAAQHWMNGDPFRLKQVLYNLLGNAIKFTLKGHVKLTVDCKQHDDNLHCYFTVEDTGIGFSEEDQEKIFREFEQGGNPNHQVINQNGTGLGLAIVKTLIDAQGGRINAKSKLGKGTSFVVYLQFKPAQMPTETISLENENAIDHRKAVWVVDDDRLILDLCELIFSTHQIPFKTFSTAEAVLAQPVDQNLAYVLLDMRLEGVTGIELHHQLRKQLPEEVKYYAITAQVLPDEQQAVLDQGFEGVIIKPFKAEDLLALFALPTDEVQSVDFDDTSLHKMTMGDQAMMAKILASFMQDCKDDQELLEQAVEDQNQAQARLVVHRLAGRIAQIGAKELGAAFRQLEQEVANLNGIDEVLKTKITTLMQQLQLLLQTIKLRISAA